MRPDAQRWLRPDAHRFMRPACAVDRAPSLYDRKYSPDQPRVPAGNPDGGQWTGEGGNSPTPTRLAQLDGRVTDADGSPYYKQGGHHEVPRQLYRGWALRPETRQVFEKSTTGTIPQLHFRDAPDGIRQGHFWSGPSGPHGIYNEAIKELSDNFLDRNRITPEQMTPEQAQALLKEIRESADPRIRNYNSMIRFLQRIFRLRTGRGE